MDKKENNGKNNISSTDSCIQKLTLSNPLREGVVCSVIKSLNLLPGSMGLDAGCGIGLQALLLADEVGYNGHITGVDISPELLSYAGKMAEKSNMLDRITFQEGDMNNLPFGNDTFDWVWSMDCAGYADSEPLPLIKELARVVKPGGRIALAAWSSQTLLPGYPLLEARLNATSMGIAPFVHGMKPENHFSRALGWFKTLGMQELTAQTFAGSISAPMCEDIRNALLSLLQMRWEKAEQEISKEDWAEYQRLCQPDSPDFILELPDYYAFFTYTLFCGSVIE